jgi:HSP20 family protein
MEELTTRLAPFLGQERKPAQGQNETMTTAEWAPLVDITEDDKEYVIKAELPEVKKEDVKVTVENGRLSISGERRIEKEQKDRKYHRLERSYGSFLRSFTLPEAASAEKVVAEFKDGVLRVHLPKEEKARPKSIDVKVQPG